MRTEDLKNHGKREREGVCKRGKKKEHVPERIIIYLEKDDREPKKGEKLYDKET